jgi:ketosteroid isomerase-like protein
MRQSTRLGLAALLVLGAGCQPRSKTETGMVGGGSEAAAVNLSDADKASVRAVDAEWARAAEAGNGEAIGALYVSDAVLLPPGEPMVKGDAAKKYWVDFTNGFSGPTELNTMAVEGGGDVATAIGTYKMSLTPKKAGAKPLPTEEGKYLEVLKRQDDGSWKIVYDMWSPNAPPAKK